MSELLTDDEHRLLDLTGELWRVLCAVVGNEPSRAVDLAEAAAHVHAIQNMVLAQAAARAYPDRYRLLGGQLTSDSQFSQRNSSVQRKPPS